MRFGFSSYVLSSGFSRKNIFESGSFKKQKRSTNQKIGFKAEKVNPAIQRGDISEMKREVPFICNDGHK